MAVEYQQQVGQLEKKAADYKLTLPKITGQLTTEADKHTIKCGLMWDIHMYI